MTANMQGRRWRQDSIEKPPQATTRQRQAFLQAATRPRRSPYWLSMVVAPLTTACLVFVGWQVYRPHVELPFWVDEPTTSGREGMTVEATATTTMGFNDGSQLTWRPRSHGQVLKSSTKLVTIALSQGELEARITPTLRSKVEWRFQAAGYSFSVKGTVLRLSVHSQEVDLEVPEGAVWATGPASPDGLLIEAGQAASFGASRAKTRTLTTAAATTNQEPEAAPARMPGVEAPNRLPDGHKRSPPAAAWKQLAQTKRFVDSLDAAKAAGFGRLTEEIDADDLILLSNTARYARDAASATQALKALSRRFPRHPESRLVPFLRGRIEQELSHEPLTAIQHFREYVAHEGDNGSLVAEARGRLIEVLRAAGDNTEAKAAALDYLQRYPEGPYAELAREVSGFSRPP